MTVTFNINDLHALIGRLQSHQDELAGMLEITPELAADVDTAVVILDGLSKFLEAIAGKIKGNGDLPEASRSSHYS